MSYFTVEEFRCKDGSLPEWAKVAIMVQLIPVCDKIRQSFGYPLRVVSGYRSPSYNASIGGALNSYHCRALAADLQPFDMSRFSRFAQVVNELWTVRVFGGKGFYDTFRHIDLGPHRTWGQELGGVKMADEDLATRLNRIENTLNVLSNANNDRAQEIVNLVKQVKEVVAKFDLYNQQRAEEIAKLVNAVSALSGAVSGLASVDSQALVNVAVDAAINEVQRRLEE